MWVRLTVLKANDLNKQIKDILGRKEKSITKNPELRKYINSMYKEIVMPYVPMSTKEHHHLKDAYVTDDGRIIWTGVNNKYDYAKIQYENFEYNHPVRYSGHKPTAHWTDMVQPGTDDWEVFVKAITPEIIRVYDNG